MWRQRVLGVTLATALAGGAGVAGAGSAAGAANAGGAGADRAAAPAPQPTRSAKPAPADPGKQTGLGSWYGDNFQGRRTASGEAYDMEELTAAHPSWPMSTWVRVIHRITGLSVVVRINDRGPFRRGRVIDLSRAAAHRLGVLGHGAFPVIVERLLGPPDEEDEPTRLAPRAERAPAPASAAE